MEIHRIRKEYSLFVDKFVEWAEYANAIVHVPGGAKISVQAKDNGNIEVKSLFHLVDWPFRGSTRKPNSGLSVLVRTKEEYQAGYVLIKSNVNTLYFRPRKQGLPAQPHTAIHYDFEFQMEDAHPMFHAQFGAREIPKEELAAVNFTKQLDLSGFDPIRSIRIPTVHVGLPAALLAVTADHLNRDAYMGFLEYVTKNRFFNDVATMRLDKCRELRLREQDQWVYRSHSIYM